jgi:hypothetical protein|tara:strand:+ start:280 stop:837 length:558 start_codon:yes stop_codon:yes gene_type:complete
MSKILVDTIDTRSGTSNITIGSSNASQITLKSGATLTNFPANTPAFFAKMSGNQTVSHDTYTTVAFNSEVYDTASAFDTSTYKFTVPSGQAGKYIFTSHIAYQNPNNGTGTRFQTYFKVNNDFIDFHGDMCQAQHASADPTLNFTTQINLSVADTVYVVTLQQANHDETLSSSWGRFFGYKLIGV